MSAISEFGRSAIAIAARADELARTMPRSTSDLATQFESIGTTAGKLYGSSDVAVVRVAQHEPGFQELVVLGQTTKTWAYTLETHPKRVFDLNRGSELLATMAQSIRDAIDGSSTIIR